MNDALVSIVIPVFNTADFFEKCLLSVINQTYKNIEIILINDGSTDNVKEIIMKYKEIDDRIVYIENETNIGAGLSRNVGIDISKGKYLYFMDSDDYLDPRTIEILCDHIKPDDLSCCMRNFRCDNNGFLKDASKSVEELELLRNPTVWIRLFNKKYIIDSGIRFKDFKVAEDLDFVFKLMMYHGNTTYINNMLYIHVYHDNSTLRTVTSHQLDTLEAIDDIYNYATKEGYYDTFKQRIEYVAVDHILVGTIYRIMRIPNYSFNDIKKCITYINKKFPNWKNNKFIQKHIMTNEKVVKRLTEVGAL